MSLVSILFVRIPGDSSTHGSFAISLIRAEDITGDKEDVKRVCKHIMNKTAARRLISKQEAMVLLGELDLVLCSDTVETVSISNSATLRQADEAHVDKTFITNYTKRTRNYSDLSLREFFHLQKNSDPKTGKKKEIIPHFVGVSGLPTFPVTESYARHTLIVYKPWTKYPSRGEWITEFDEFINSPNCPPSAKLGYERVMCRHYDKMTHYEVKSTSVDHTSNPVSSEDADLIALTGLGNPKETDAETVSFLKMDKGLDFKWDKEPVVRNV